jgi:hypothetical protein
VPALITFARRLARESRYVVEEQTLAGVRLLSISGHDEIWVMWAAQRTIVKIGGRGIERVPAALISAYGERYPSRLRAGDLDRPLPETGRPGETDDPTGRPAPDWDTYQPGSPGSPRGSDGANPERKR